MEGFNDDAGHIVVFTPNELMYAGLQFLYTEKQIQGVQKKKNTQRFIDHYGAKPAVYARIWDDLQSTHIQKARAPPESLCLKYFLMAMHALKHYPTEAERESQWGITEKPGRQWGFGST